jgi:uracil-DNA glycosylase family 4
MSALTDLYEQIALCVKCDIARLRTKVVPGEGAENAEIMFIGEAPGWHEDQQGRPFVGQAGQYLDRLLASIGLDRQQVYIANVIKCRPPDNREPLPTEIQNCQPWLDSQIDLIKPKMIVTGKSISKIHGTAQKREGVIYYAMYHPAAALHQQSLKMAIEADMLKIPKLLVEASRIEESQPSTEDGRQLNMFEV